MKLRKVFAGLLVIVMALSTPCMTLAEGITENAAEDIEFNSGDVAIAINTCLASDMIMNEDNLRDKNCLEAEVVFETAVPQGLTAAGEEEEEETEYFSLQQTLEETDEPYVDVIAGEPDEETGMSRTERFFKPLDLSGITGSQNEFDLPELQAGSGYEKGQTKIINSQVTVDYYRQVEVECLYIGEYCTVWCEVDEDYPQLTMSEAHAQELAEEFDGNWENFSSYYGDYKTSEYPEDFGSFETMDLDGDGKLALICYDINRARSENCTEEDGRFRLTLTQYTGGFFWTGDLLPKAYVPYSNEIDCIHIDTVCAMSRSEEDDSIIDDEAHIFGDMEHAYSTLFHEAQHLTEAARTCFRALPSYLDEAFAMSAEHLVCGSGSTAARVKYFNKYYTYGCPLTMWCYEGYPMKSCLENYSSSYIFGQYLRTRYAQEGKSSKTTGEDRGADVYDAILSSYTAKIGDDFNIGAADKSALSTEALEDVFGVSMEQLVEDFWLTICLQEENGTYSFSSDGEAPEEWSKAITARFETELPEGKTKIYNGGAKFYTITENGTNLKTEYLKNAEVLKISEEADTYDVEFRLASPSDAVREYSTVYETVSVSRGEQAEKPDDPDPEDYGIDGETYDFSGWFEDTALELPFDFDEPVNEDKVAYGSWIEKSTKKSITVTFCANAPEDAVADVDEYTQTATANESFTLEKNAFTLDCPLMEYTFFGWSSTSDLESPDCEIYLDEEEVVFTKNTKLYAIWLQDYDNIVIFDANGGEYDYCALVDDGEVIEENEIPDPTRRGYRFYGWWYMDEEGIEYLEKYEFGTPITENIYLCARWLAKSSGNSGSSSVPAFSKAADPDPAVTQVTTAANGNRMMGNATISVRIGNLSAEEKAALVTNGSWVKDTGGYWSLKAENGDVYKNCWVLVADTLSSESVGNATWYYFDIFGHMLTGWQWIPAADGKKYCYYFNKENNSMYGGCILNGTTVDNYTVDAAGRWTDNGVPQTR